MREKVIMIVGGGQNPGKLKSFEIMDTFTLTTWTLLTETLLETSAFGKRLLYMGFRKETLIIRDLTNNIFYMDMDDSTSRQEFAADP